MLGPLAVEKHEKRSELKDYMGIIIPIAAILVLICSYTGDLKTRSHEIYTQQSERDTGIQQFIEQAKKDGAKTLVQDLSHDKSLAVYYFFDKPFQSMTKYFKSNRGTLELVDIGSDKMVVALVEGSNLYPGWELDSERKLRILLSERPVHFLYVNTFSNEILIKLLYQKCEERMKGSKYILFKCKKEEP
jgi:hypothetical protein